jgi:hypothetical protein
MKTRLIVAALIALTFCVPAVADSTYKPFVLASVNEAGLAEQADATVDALESAGFSISGKYQPLENTLVIVATSDALKEIAAASDRGGYAVGQRVSVTERDGKTEVAFVNPVYLQYAYHLGADMQPVFDSLAAALGHVESFGSEKGLTAKTLGKYKYTIGMPKFDDPSELGSFGSFGEAVAAVEKGLATEGDALSQVYRIDIPGKDQAVFGVGMKATGNNEDEEDIDEALLMSVVDFDGPAKAAYFPYEIMVNGTEVEALHMKYRMALHFPDLSMMGAHGFMKLRSSPGAVEDAFEMLVTDE